MFLAGNLWIESFMIINTGTAINMQSLLYLKNGLIEKDKFTYFYESISTCFWEMTEKALVGVWNNQNRFEVCRVSEFWHEGNSWELVLVLTCEIWDITWFMRMSLSHSVCRLYVWRKECSRNHDGIGILLGIKKDAA